MTNPLLTPWVPIADSHYERPLFSGEYDVLHISLRAECGRYFYDKPSDTWRTEGGARIWEWATDWRGCTIPYAVED